MFLYISIYSLFSFFFFFNDTATTEIYTLSLHDALPILYLWTLPMFHCNGWCFPWTMAANAGTSVCLRRVDAQRSEEHTSELQSPCNLVCRLLLEKKKKKKIYKSDIYVYVISQ